jgi:Raf kinase inhibitor-like YbhB/YbcL family protein
MRPHLGLWRQSATTHGDKRFRQEQNPCQAARLKVSRMKLAPLLLCLLVLACSDQGAAQRMQDRHALASARAETQAAAIIPVSSPAFAANGPIPLRHSAYGDGISPPLSWSGLPAAARSLVLMMEDPDAVSARPYVHWLAWNIDPALMSLPQGIAEGGEPPHPAGLRQGRNTRGITGYFGPRPRGSRPHHYHFQLFALDTRLDLAAGANRGVLLQAMNGHVIAKGDLVGLFAAPQR